MPRDMQTAFNAGELDPSLHSHADLAKYRSGLALCKNWQVLAQGGIQTRPGFEWISEVEDSNSLARLIDFSFNTEQAYALVFTDQKMRVVRNGAMVLETSQNITGATQANPVEITIVGHSYTSGDDVFISAVVGMTEINNRFFTITVTGANTFTIGVDGTGYTAYASGGTAGRVYTLATPYLEADLFRLKYTQKADVMTITHPGYQQRDLSRTDHDNWTLATVTFAAGIAAPSAGFGITQVGTASGSNNKVYRYVVTSIDESGGESVASAVQTSASVNALNETYGNRVSWNTVSGASYYNVYKELSLNSGIFGWIGEANEDGSPTFDDYNFGPDMSVTPPLANNPFNGADDYPSCTTYHDQRQWYANTNNNKQTVWATRVADFDNMDKSRPLRDDDALEKTINSRQVNEIRHLISLDDLVVFTSGAEWRIVGDQDGVITPSSNFRPQGYRGSSHVRPVVIGEVALFIQEKGARVRDLGYTFEDDKYTGGDLTILARHLFKGKTIVDWCYAQEPYSVVWAVRSDGVLLSLTYLREHQVYAWAQHDTAGTFESVCAISEGDEDVVYAVVKRNINGADVRYVERMKEFEDEVIEDAFFVDSGLTYSGSATTSITGLNHLEGEDVIVLADGNVVEDLTVTDGAITLPEAASKVHVGLTYNCDFSTLEVSFEGGVAQSRKKTVARVALRVVNSRGLKVGKDFTTMHEFKGRTPAMGYGAIPLKTGEERISYGATWSDYGQINVRQPYPLPSTVIAVIPEIEVGS